MSKHNQSGNRRQSPDEPPDTTKNSQEEALDHRAQEAALTELRAFCWWTAPIIEEALSGLIRLNRYPTTEIYQEHIIEAGEIRESAAPIIRELQAIEDKLHNTDTAELDLAALKSRSTDLAGLMAEFIQDIYGLRFDIISRFTEANNSHFAQMDDTTPTEAFSEEDLIDDRNNRLAMLINIPRQKAQALATIRIFTKQDDGVSIADVLAGCAFLPYNLAGSSNSQDAADQSEVLQVSPQIAASAIYAAFLAVRESQEELFNYCLQSSLSEWGETGGPDLFYDVIKAIASKELDAVNFNQKKIAALRAIATTFCPVRVYENAGEIVASFLIPADIEGLENEAAFLVTQFVERIEKELRSFDLRPIMITKLRGEMLELGVSLSLPCSGELKAHSEETSSIIQLHSQEDFVESLALLLGDISLAVNLADKDLFAIELPRRFFVSEENGSDKTQLLRSTLDLCGRLNSSALARINRLPADQDNFDDDSDPGEVTIVRTDMPKGGVSSETAVGRLARLYKICALSEGMLPKDPFSTNSNLALRMPASWLADHDLRGNLLKLSSRVEIADLDLIAFSNELFEGAPLETSTRVLAHVTSLLRDFRTSLGEHGRPLLYMPLKASSYMPDGAVKFYLASEAGGLLGVGRIPTDGSSLPNLTLFPSAIVEKFGRLVTDVTQSISEASKISGTLMYKFQNAIRGRGVILSEDILNELCDEYASNLSPITQSEVERIIYTGVAGLGDEVLIRADYQPKSSSEVYYLALFTKIERFFLNPEE